MSLMLLRVMIVGSLIAGLAGCIVNEELPPEVFATTGGAGTAGPPIAVTLTASTQPRIGEPLTLVCLYAVEEADAGGRGGTTLVAYGHFSPGDAAFAFESGDSSWVEKVASNQPRQHSVVVTPLARGRHTVSVSVLVYVDALSGPITGRASIPVDVQ